MARSIKDISLSQRHYVLQLMSSTGHFGCKTRKTPMDPNVKLSQDERELLTDPFQYKVNWETFIAHYYQTKLIFFYQSSQSIPSQAKSTISTSYISGSSVYQ